MQSSSIPPSMQDAYERSNPRRWFHPMLEPTQEDIRKSVAALAASVEDTTAVMSPVAIVVSNDNDDAGAGYADNSPRAPDDLSSSKSVSVDHRDQKREMELLSEAKLRMSVYSDALQSLRAMKDIFHAYDPALGLPSPTNAKEVTALKELKIRSLRAKTNRARRRREQLTTPRNTDPEQSLNALQSSGLEEEESVLSDEEHAIRTPLPPTDEEEVDGDDAAAQFELGDSSELRKHSRWGPHASKGNHGGTLIIDDQAIVAAAEDDPLVMEEQRRLIEETIAARSEELTTIQRLLDDFCEGQEARSHELDSLQSQRVVEVREIGQLIADFAERKDAEVLVHDLEMRMKLANMPLELRKPLKAKRDASNQVQTEDFVLRPTKSSSALPSSATRQLLAAAGGGLAEPPVTIILPSAITQRMVPPPQISVLAALFPERLAAAAAAGPVTPDDMVFLLKLRFGEDLQRKVWSKDPVAFTTATAQFLALISKCADKWKGYLSDAVNREEVLLAFTSGADAVSFFQDLDNELLATRWDSCVRAAPSCELVTDEHYQQQGTGHQKTHGDEAATTTAATESNKFTTLFQGPRLAGALCCCKFSNHSKGRLRCDYNPATLRYSYVGPDVCLVSEILSVARGGELLCTRDVWRAVLLCDSRRFPGSLLSEVAYRLVSAEVETRFPQLKEMGLTLPLPGGAMSSTAEDRYTKLMSVVAFELRARQQVLGPHLRQLAERNFIQPALPCVFSCSPANGGVTDSEFKARGGIDVVALPGDQIADAQWIFELPVAEQSAGAGATKGDTNRAGSGDVASLTTAGAKPIPLAVMFHINTPEVFNIGLFRKIPDTTLTSSGFVSVMVPHADCLMLQPKGAACMELMYKVMWLTARRVACHNGGRMYLSNQLHAKELALPHFRDDVTSDPMEAKAMMCEFNCYEIVWMFRDPLAAAAFAVQFQTELTRVSWPEDFSQFYEATLPAYQERQERESTIAWEDACEDADPSSSTASPTSLAGGGGGGGTARYPTRRNGGITPQCAQGLRVSMGVSSGVPTMRFHRPTRLLKYGGPSLDYAKLLAAYARVGETLIAPRDRERLMGTSGAVVDLPVVGLFYHLVAVSPVRVPDHLKVHAVVSSALRDRQSVFGELPAVSLGRLNQQYLSIVKGSLEQQQQLQAQFQRRTSIMGGPSLSSSMAITSPLSSSGNKERLKNIVAKAISAVREGQSASPVAAAATSPRNPSLNRKSEVFDMLSLSLEGERIPSEALDFVVKLLESGEKAGLVHPLMLGKESMLPTWTNLSHVAGTTGGGSVKASNEASGSARRSSSIRMQHSTNASSSSLRDRKPSYPTQDTTTTTSPRVNNINQQHDTLLETPPDAHLGAPMALSRTASTSSLTALVPAHMMSSRTTSPNDPVSEPTTHTAAAAAVKTKFTKALPVHEKVSSTPKNEHAGQDSETSPKVTNTSRQEDEEEEVPPHGKDRKAGDIEDGGDTQWLSNHTTPTPTPNTRHSQVFAKAKPPISPPPQSASALMQPRTLSLNMEKDEAAGGGGDPVLHLPPLHPSTERSSAKHFPPKSSVAVASSSVAAVDVSDDEPLIPFDRQQSLHDNTSITLPPIHKYRGNGDTAPLIPEMMASVSIHRDEREGNNVDSDSHDSTFAKRRRSSKKKPSPANLTADDRGGLMTPLVKSFFTPEVVPIVPPPPRANSPEFLSDGTDDSGTTHTLKTNKATAGEASSSVAAVVVPATGVSPLPSMHRTIIATDSMDVGVQADEVVSQPSATPLSSEHTSFAASSSPTAMSSPTSNPSTAVIQELQQRIKTVMQDRDRWREAARSASMRYKGPRDDIPTEDSPRAHCGCQTEGAVAEEAVVQTEMVAMVSTDTQTRMTQTSPMPPLPGQSIHSSDPDDASIRKGFAGDNPLLSLTSISHAHLPAPSVSGTSQLSWHSDPIISSGTSTDPSLVFMLHGITPINEALQQSQQLLPASALGTLVKADSSPERGVSGMLSVNSAIVQDVLMTVMSATGDNNNKNPQQAAAAMTMTVSIPTAVRSTATSSSKEHAPQEAPPSIDTSLLPPLDGEAPLPLAPKQLVCGVGSLNTSNTSSPHLPWSAQISPGGLPGVVSFPQALQEQIGSVVVASASQEKSTSIPSPSKPDGQPPRGKPERNAAARFRHVDDSSSLATTATATSCVIPTKFRALPTSQMQLQPQPPPSGTTTSMPQPSSVTHNSFTGYCEDVLFATMREREQLRQAHDGTSPPPPTNTYPKVADVPLVDLPVMSSARKGYDISLLHLSQQKGAASGHTPGAPKQQQQQQQALQPPRVKADGVPSGGSSWIDEVNRQIREYTKEAQRAMH